MKRLLLYTLSLTLGALLAAGNAAGAATAAAEKMPYETDSSNQAAWWSPQEEFGGATYFTYNRPGPTDGEHRVNVAKRSSGGSWTTGCLKNSSGACTAYWDDVGHNQPSIGVDGDGFVHAFVSMHNDAWRYYRSGSPGGVSDMVDRSSEMPDGGDRYTYPVLERAPNGDLYLLIRARPPGSDSTYGRLYRWNDATDAWSRVATFAYQGGYSVYPDDLQADANGDLHILYEWHLAPAGPTRHLGSYLRYSPSTGKFYKADGSAVAVPASTGTGDVYQPFERAEGWTPDGDNTSAGLQGAKLAVYPTGGGYKPSVAYRYREADGGFYKVRRARWDGSGWAKETVYGGKYDTYAAVDTTHDGSVARVYYAKKNTLGGDQAHAATKTPSSVSRSRCVSTARTYSTWRRPRPSVRRRENSTSAPSPAEGGTADYRKGRRWRKRRTS